MTTELQKSRVRIIEMIDDKTRLESEAQRLWQEKKEFKSTLDQRAKRIQELEFLVKDTKHKSHHLVMNFETKNIAINEVSARNDILNESVEKLRNELHNTKKTYA